MNIITWKAYLRNLYYDYELARNLATRSKNQTFILGFLYNSECFRCFPIGFVDSIQICPTDNE